MAVAESLRSFLAGFLDPGIAALALAFAFAFVPYIDEVIHWLERSPMKILKLGGTAVISLIFLVLSIVWTYSDPAKVLVQFIIQAVMLSVGGVLALRYISTIWRQ